MIHCYFAFTLSGTRFLDETTVLHAFKIYVHSYIHTRVESNAPCVICVNRQMHSVFLGRQIRSKL